MVEQRRWEREHRGRARTPQKSHPVVRTCSPCQLGGGKGALELINNFVMGIKAENRNWISKDLLYTPTSKGGFGIIRLHDFTKAIKCSWVKRYCIDKLMTIGQIFSTHFSISHLTPGTQSQNSALNVSIP